MSLPKIEVGIRGIYEIIVTDDWTATRIPGKPGVLTTPMLTRCAERATDAAVQPYLTEGYSVVGGRVDVKHLAPTPAGMRVRAEAKLVEIAGRKMIFECEIFDEVEKIGEARTWQFLIEDSGKVSDKLFQKIDLVNSRNNK